MILTAVLASLPGWGTASRGSLRVALAIAGLCASFALAIASGPQDDPRRWPTEYGELVPLTVRGHSFLIPARHILYRPPSRGVQDGFVLRFRLSDLAAPTPATVDSFHWDVVAGRAVQVMFAGYLDPDDTTLNRILGRTRWLFGHDGLDAFAAPSTAVFGLQKPALPPITAVQLDIFLGALPDGRPVLVECSVPSPFGGQQRCRYTTDWRGVPVRTSTSIPLREDWQDVMLTTLQFFDRLAR
jgi:hypothetical protein